MGIDANRQGDLVRHARTLAVTFTGGACALAAAFLCIGEGRGLLAALATEIVVGVAAALTAAFGGAGWFARRAPHEAANWFAGAGFLFAVAVAATGAMAGGATAMVRDFIASPKSARSLASFDPTESVFPAVLAVLLFGSIPIVLLGTTFGLLVRRRLRRRATEPV